MEFEIKGITRERNWFFITPSELLNRADFPAATFYEGLGCWVFNGTGVTEGDLGGVEMMKGPDYKTPTPIPATVDCASYKTDGQCNEHADVCYWQKIMSTAGTPGVCKPK
jgi:hypothetical protein